MERRGQGWAGPVVVPILRSPSSPLPRRNLLPDRQGQMGAARAAYSRLTPPALHAGHATRHPRARCGFLEDTPWLGGLTSHSKSRGFTHCYTKPHQVDASPNPGSQRINSPKGSHCPPKDSSDKISPSEVQKMRILQ